ncbi:MAG: hypothetical protein ACP6IQ_10305 [Candidatus Njordarchaeia archaeon]
MDHKKDGGYSNRDLCLPITFATLVNSALEGISGYYEDLLRDAVCGYYSNRLQGTHSLCYKVIILKAEQVRQGWKDTK